MPNQVYWAFGSSTSLWVVYYNGSGTIAAALSSMPPSCHRQSGRVMPSQSKMTRIKTRARAPEGKRQVLIIMDQEVIKSVKVAAVEDDIKMSHAVEEAVRDWLSKRKRERAASNAV